MNLFKNLPQPVGRFFQNNWFSMAMFGLVFVMVLRAGWRAESANEPRPTHPIDKKMQLDASERPIKFTENASENVFADKMGYSISSEQATILPDFGTAAATAFLKRFAKVAMIEQQKFGIPASIILSAAMVESAAGQRDLAMQGNNFFSLPEICAGSNGQFSAQNGRKYGCFKTPWDSFRANSLFLNEKFGNQKAALGKNWRSWANVLSRGGYSDLPDFEARVTRVITEFHLDAMDK